jgi:hypothetical protein
MVAGGLIYLSGADLREVRTFGAEAGTAMASLVHGLRPLPQVKSSGKPESLPQLKPPDADSG